MTVYMPESVPQSLRGQVTKLISDVEVFAQIHKVQQKRPKKMVPFQPLPMQEKIFEAVRQGKNRIVIIKARQVTATTGCKFVLHHAAYTTEHEAMHAVVSMRDDSATEMMADFRRWGQHPPSLLQRPHKAIRGSFTYEDTKASVRAFTSRSVDGLRSFSPAAALISEAAYAPDLEETLAGADAAVGDGLLMVESTVKNPNDFFSNLVRGAPENGWTLLTMWWWEHPAYTDAPDDPVHGFDEEEFKATLTADELALQQEYSLSLGQLHWARRTRTRLGSDHKFRREYPGCLDDCFIAREGGYFSDEDLSGIHVVEHALHDDEKGREIEAPNPFDRYVIGSDVGGGVGGDYHTLCVVSVATRQPVYVERNNTITPSQWAHRLVQVASRYNKALILVEANNHGNATLNELNHCSYREQWRNPQGKPWLTTLKSKLEAYDVLRECLSLVQILDRVTWLELRSLTIPPGKVAPEAPKGSHDDAAMAIALAYRCLQDVPAAWRSQAVMANRNRVDDLIAASRARRIRSSALPF